MTLLNYTFNYALDNGFLFWGALTCTAGFIGYEFTSSYLNSFYVDKGVQTEELVIFGLGIISILTGGTGNIVVTVLKLSDVVCKTDDVSVGDIGVIVSIEVTLFEPIWLGLLE